MCHVTVKFGVHIIMLMEVAYCCLTLLAWCIFDMKFKGHHLFGLQYSDTQSDRNIAEYKVTPYCLSELKLMKFFYASEMSVLGLLKQRLIG